MSAGARRRLRGRIILVQEDRFRLVGHSGQSLLLTLSRRWNRQKKLSAPYRVIFSSKHRSGRCKARKPKDRLEG
jgi:hypothetical protein